MGTALLRQQFSRFSGVGNGDQFPDPFLDVASLAVPGTMRNALYWCEYIFNTFGTYRMAMERVISYFLTEPDIKNVSQDEKEKWTEFLNDTIDVMSVLQNMLRDRMCFHGDVPAVTRNGIFKLRDLVGQTVDVLSQGGVYRPATFKSFGRQRLLEVTFSDGRKLLATPEHEWVAKNCSGKTVRVPTTTLRKGYRVPRVVAQRPERNADYFEGIRHGFTYGDGSLYNEGKQAEVTFFGAKDREMISYFAGHGGLPVPDEATDSTTIYGLPAHYKELPANEASASYWYGFVSGFLAADGSCDVWGCAILTQTAKSPLEVIAKQLPRIGMAGGPLRNQFRTSKFVRKNGKIDVYEGFMHYVTLLKQCMQPDDFLLSQHRENFEQNYKPTKYGQYIGVTSVEDTGIVDEVFCCVEMETHTFVVDNGVLTGNCYGNSFASIIIPFKRFLACPKCGNSWALKTVAETASFNFAWQMPEFHASCPTCKVGSGYRGKFNIDDKTDDQEDKIRIKRWNPHEIEILHDPYSDDAHYLWRIPEDYKRMVRQGNLFHLERVTKAVLKAIQLNQVFRFQPDTIYHMKEPTLAGILNRGWGIPRIITNFRQIWYVQVLHRFNEAIALDYVIPFRLITPGQKSGGGGMSGAVGAQDPLLMYNGGDFRGQVQSMIRRRRRDPASWQILPFPVNYQMLGAEANQLAPRELMDQGVETLLNDAGTPVELYKGSLQMQTAPVALRLFESTWHHLVNDANSLLSWVVEQVAEILSWEAVKATLKRVTIADDVQKQMTALQLMMSQQLSGTSGLAALGYNWPQEQKQMAEEAREQAEIQARTQEEMEQAGFAQQVAKGQMGGDPSQGGGAPPGGGGAPPGGGGGGDPSAMGGAAGTSMQGPVSSYIQSMSPQTPQTPQDMMAAADSIAQQLLGQPEGTKDSELRRLKQANPVLHSLVKARMEDTRNQAKSQAGAAAMQQMQQGGGG